jgi:hypothetical protein
VRRIRSLSSFNSNHLHLIPYHNELKEYLGRVHTVEKKQFQTLVGRVLHFLRFAADEEGILLPLSDSRASNSEEIQTFHKAIHQYIFKKDVKVMRMVSDATVLLLCFVTLVWWLLVTRIMLICMSVVFHRCSKGMLINCTVKGQFLPPSTITCWILRSGPNS